MLPIAALIASLLPSAAFAADGISACAAALQFDTTIVEQNYLAKLSILNVVTSSNYEESKKNYGASIPGYFGGNFDDFQKKRADITQTLALDSSISSQSNFFQRVLSPAGAKAYSDCVAAVTPAPLRAYISSGQRSEFVAVTVVSGGTGNSMIKLDIIFPDYIQRLTNPKVLTAGSSQTLLFKSPVNRPFLVIFNGEEATSGTSYSPTTIEMPAYVEYRLVNSYRELTSKGVCGAGGGGSTAGSPLRESVYFSAPSGYKLMPETLILSERRVTGLNNAGDPSWAWTKQPNSDRPDTMRGDPSPCDGVSPHTQSRVEYHFNIRAVSQSITKVGS